MLNVIKQTGFQNCNCIPFLGENLDKINYCSYWHEGEDQLLPFFKKIKKIKLPYIYLPEISILKSSPNYFWEFCRFYQLYVNVSVSHSFLEVLILSALTAPYPHYLYTIIIVNQWELGAVTHSLHPSKQEQKQYPSHCCFRSPHISGITSKLFRAWSHPKNISF